MTWTQGRYWVGFSFIHIMFTCHITTTTTSPPSVRNISFFSTGKIIGGFCALSGVFILTLPIPIVVNRQKQLGNITAGYCKHYILLTFIPIVVNSFAPFYKNRLWRNEVPDVKLLFWSFNRWSRRRRSISRRWPPTGGWRRSFSSSRLIFGVFQFFVIFFQAMVTSATAAAGIATVRNRPPKLTSTQC